MAIFYVAWPYQEEKTIKKIQQNIKDIERHHHDIRFGLIGFIPTHYELISG